MRFGTNQPAPANPLGGPRLVFILLVFGALVVLLAFGVQRYVGPEGGRAGRGSPVAEEGVAVTIDPERRRGTKGRSEALRPVPAPAPPVGAPEPIEGEIDWSALDVVDGDDELSTDGLVALFRQIRNDATWVNEPVDGVEQDTTALWSDLDRDPASHRGKALFLEGSLVAADRHASPLELAPLPRGNPSGLDRYYEAYLFDGARLYMVALWRHSGVPFADGDTVRARARFLQLFRYDIERDGKTVSARIPVVVADSFTRVPGGRPIASVFGPFAIFVVVFGLVFAVVLAVCVGTFRRGDREFRRRLGELRQRGGRGSGGARKVRAS